ncbi:MAG TPA: DUF4433 domain-containing protein [Bryobacteraceae bacterium]|nr:DUF4433 domain-containing protein [Bryobacteraceae bacterium]
MPPPAQPKIYHITHVDNLPSIIAEGCLVSDAVMIARGGPSKAIGMSTIKQRRLGLLVECHPGDHVGDYVPFYFCFRSVMLYLIYMANHSELTYRGGQGPIVHLEADLLSVVGWANEVGRRWAFSLSNAGSYYAQFRKDLDDLGEVNWPAVASTDFRPADIKEGKQAEYLLHGSFPWGLVNRIGVHSMGVAQMVDAALSAAAHRPRVEIRPDWYY